MWFKNETKALRLKVEELETQIEGLEYKKQIAHLKDELSDLKHQKKMELEDIAHMTKIATEKNELAHERRITELESEKIQEIAVVKDGYREKVEANLIEEKNNIRGMYDEILKRLPNVQVNLGDKNADAD